MRSADVDCHDHEKAGIQAAGYSRVSHYTIEERKVQIKYILFILDYPLHPLHNIPDHWGIQGGGGAHPALNFLKRRYRYRIRGEKLPKLGIRPPPRGQIPEYASGTRYIYI